MNTNSEKSDIRVVSDTELSPAVAETISSQGPNVLGSPLGSIASIRKVILLYAVAVVLLLGFPWFICTTTIHRAALPIEEIDLFESQLNSVQVSTPVFVDFTNVEVDIGSVQSQFNTVLYQQYPNLQQVWSVEFTGCGPDAVNTYEDVFVAFDSSLESDYFISPFEKKVVFKQVSTDGIVNTLINEVFQGEITKFDRLVSNNFAKLHENVVIPYASNYNLIFSLMVEDGDVVDWDKDSIYKLIHPLLQNLNHFANFTVSTQVQYYSKLQIERTYDEASNSYVVKESDLSNFINFSDWNLNNHDINPSINFIIYYPSSNKESIPMVIENSNTNSFLIPQYGGLHILQKKIDVVNDDDEAYITDVELIEVLEIFSGQLFKLLGIESSKPKNTLLRIDSLTRYSIMSNLHQSLKTLKSLVKLTNELQEISVPELTKSYMHRSLTGLESSIKALQRYNIESSMIDSSVSLKNSFAAFFDKDIVQQVYFPSEHKLAVFLPLIGPLCSILVFSTIRQVKELKNRK